MSTQTNPAASDAATGGGGDASKDIWRRGLPHEAAFWHKQLIEGDPRWPGVQVERARRDRPLAEAVRRLIQPPPPEGAEVRILDVGSGPLTVLGSVWEGRTVTIVPTDPLADEYNRWIDQAGLSPPFRPIKVDAEELATRFEEGSFDLTFSHNALDHCYDPVSAIRQMLRLTKRGCCVRLEHVPNEGQREDYVGLHQWNFDSADGRFIIWNPRVRVDVTELLAGVGVVTCTAQPNWLTVTIRRV